jgi:hypothetical protein
MEQGRSNMGAIVLAIIITAVIVSGAYYLYITPIATVEGPKTAIETPAVATTLSTQKSLVEYFATREQFINSGMPKDNKGMNKEPEVLGFKELATIEVICPDSAGTPCSGGLLILSKDLLHSGNQEFYLAFTMGTGYVYYGPFTDDLQRIVNESKSIDSLKK